MNETSRSFTSIPIPYYLSVTQSGLITVANLIVVAAITRYKTLRQKKEYFIVAALAFADAFCGCSTMLDVLYQIYVMVTNTHLVLVTGWDCMLKGVNIFLIFSSQCSSCMLACISVDRLLAVAVPFRYFTFKHRYAKLLVGSFYLFAIAGGVVVIAGSYMEPRVVKYKSLCLTGWAIGNPILLKYYIYIRALGGFVNVALYLFIPIIYKRKKAKVSTQQVVSINDKNNAKFQKRLMITLGISACFTFIFYVVGNFVKPLVLGTPNAAVLMRLVVCWQNMNPLLNIFLYTGRHSDIRDAIKGLFTRKSDGAFTQQQLQKRQKALPTSRNHTLKNRQKIVRRDVAEVHELPEIR